MIKMGKLTIGQLMTVGCLLLSIEAENILGGNGSTDTTQFRMVGDEVRCRVNCKSPGANYLRSKDSLVKKKDDDIQSLGDFHLDTKEEETEVMRGRKERRRQKRKRRKKSGQGRKRKRGEHAGGRRRRRRRKKHLREEEPFERGEMKKRERMRRRRRLYEEQKEFQR